MNSDTQVVWFKRDLRTQDHLPLTQAVSAARALNQHDPLRPLSSVLCLYIHEPSAVSVPECARQHTAFLRECLDDLRQQLQALGGDLLEVVGEAVDVLDRLRVHFEREAGTQRFAGLWSHQETTSARDFERDKSVKRWCNRNSIETHEFGQNAVVRGRARQASHGESFEEHLKHACQEPLIALARADCEGAWAALPWPTAVVQSIPQGVGHDLPGRVRGGRTAALKRLAVFTQPTRLSAYPKAMSAPLEAEDGCSRLSPHISFGTVSDREVLRAANDAANLANSNLPASRAEWVQRASAFFAQRFYWRSGYLQMLERHPEVEEGGDVHALIGLREPHFDADRFERWATGQTGFPMVDASMRKLHESGWVNMRMRGMLASFALNELWLPPKEVGQHLARLFLDFEPAIHWGQISIHAGLLSSSRPLVYNPVKQAQDNDPTGQFVRTWVPELSRVPLQRLFEPWTMSAGEQEASRCVIGVDYPDRMVDFQAASKCAKDRVYALREGKPDPGGLPFECTPGLGGKSPQRTPIVKSQMSLF